MEIHEDALAPGARVLLVDDLLATGGTAEAGVKLIEKLGAEIVAAAFVDRPARARRPQSGSTALGIDVHMLCEFEGA